MRKSKFSESTIVTLLKEAEAGRKVADICREHGISTATFYQWRSKYGGMEASDIKRPNERGNHRQHATQRQCQGDKQKIAFFDKFFTLNL